MIRLHEVDGQDPDEAPAIICRPGGVLDLHGAPMSRTWLDLAAPTEPGATKLELVTAPKGWRVGDELPITVDGLTMTGVRRSGMPMIQISANNPDGNASSHFRHVTVEKDAGRAVVNLGGGPRLTPNTPSGVPVVLHDWYGEGRSAEVVSTRSPEFKAEPKAWREDPPLTGDESRAREIATPAFPQLLDPVDDLPPVSVITWPRAHDVVRGKTITVHGTSTDNTDVVTVNVNGTAATSTDGTFHQWTAEIPFAKTITVVAKDEAGNVEQSPHRVSLENSSRTQ